jgi:hypothetical protein
MPAPPAPKAPPRRSAGRPPKIRNRARWGLYVDAQHRSAGEARAAAQGHGEYTDVMRALMAAYAAGELDAAAARAPYPDTLRSH